MFLTLCKTDISLNTRKIPKNSQYLACEPVLLFKGIFFSYLSHGYSSVFWCTSRTCAVIVYLHLKVLPHNSQGNTKALWISAICFCNTEVDAHLVWQRSQVRVSSLKCSRVKCWFNSIAVLKFLSHWSHLHSIFLSVSSEGWSEKKKCFFLNLCMAT